MEQDLFHFNLNLNIQYSIPMLGHACRKAYLPSVRQCLLERSISTSKVRLNQAFNPSAIERVEEEVDVCIVGAGPAGLSAAIRLKQLEREKGNEIRVVVLEKGSEAGAYTVFHWLFSTSSGST